MEAELERLQRLDIIEPVTGPTRWVNLIVPVPKSNDRIRLCLDMRRANEAIIRERPIILKVEHIGSELHGANLFSKLDLREGYHQIDYTQIVEISLPLKHTRDCIATRD